MKSTKPKILLTKYFAPENLVEISSVFEVLSIDFIQIKETPFNQVKNLLPPKSNWIITSQRAAQWTLNNKIKGDFFCVGQTSTNLLKQEFSVIETSLNAKSLGRKIVEAHSQKSFVYLCGNLRRPDLPSALKKAKISLKEIEIYQTLLTPPQIKNEFNSYVFFSPSGVSSFLKKYTIPSQATVFAIGETTKKALEKQVKQSIITAPKPQLKPLLTHIKNTTHDKK